MIKGTVTSKGQITIPKEVRDFLNIGTEDIVVFDLDRNKNLVIMTKGNKVCPLCNGEGYVDGKECFLCEGSGTIESMRALDQIYRLMCNSLKYKVAVGIINQGTDNKNVIGFNLIPKITLQGQSYPQDVLEKARTYYQIRFIEESLEGLEDKIRDMVQYKLPGEYTGNEEKFETVYDVMRDYAVSLMNTDEGIAAVKEIFDIYMK